MSRGGTWALVPARSFATAKSRLGLPRSARAALARALFGHVCDAVAASSRLAGLLVATDGDDVADDAAARGLGVLYDQGQPPLAAVVDRGLAQLAARGATAALVVMADLPLVAASDLDAVVAALADADVAAAPDRDELGTNALAIRLDPDRAAATCFGHRDSYLRHVAATAAGGLRLATCRRPGLAFDLDWPDDVDALLASGAAAPALEAEARVLGQRAVRAERVSGVVDLIERIATAAVRAGVVEASQDPVQRRPLGRNATGGPRGAP